MKLISLFLLSFLSLETRASCLNSSPTGERTPRDPLARILQSAGSDCPENVVALKSSLARINYKTHPSMVANRGRHNSSRGSFSFFEMVTGNGIEAGEVFFGHFTTLNRNTDGRTYVIDLDQKPSKGKLLIEAIAYDRFKKVFNFYELIGHGSGGTWFYRGDSFDAIADNAHFQIVKRPFGRRMRCSACHTSGEPIMKELSFPHNDWWTKARPLPLAGHRPSIHTKQIMNQLVDASSFAKSVKRGIQLVQKSENLIQYKKKRNFQEAIRPLFCTTSINLTSAYTPNSSPAKTSGLPVHFFVNPLLTGTKHVPISITNYKRQVSTLGFRFPEGGLTDADHPFLAPVKSAIDLAQIKESVRMGWLTKLQMVQVLAFDFKNPLFSAKRCALLKFVPSNWSRDWYQTFLNRVDETRTGQAFIHHTRKSSMQLHSDISKHIKSIDLNSEDSMRRWLRHLDRTRKSVFKHPLSQNPLGQILEPGFRVIFPLL